jgi:hypothetical protein
MRSEIQIEEVEMPKTLPVEVSIVPYARQEADKKRNGNNPGQKRVQRHADLKIQGLLPVVIDEFVLIAIRQPKYQRYDELPEGNKETAQGGSMDQSRKGSFVFAQ